MALDAGNKIVNSNTGIVAEGKDIAGSYFSIDKLTNVPGYSKIEGALCFVTEENKMYQYNGTDWELFENGKVDDVKVNGSSVVTNKIANIDLTVKQDKIDSSHKLLSDLVDDTDQTNKFVTTSEKETWSGKQDAITSSNKLSADLVQDGTTNKTVTLAEKDNWNSKQGSLPTPINNKFLHTSNTGQLEWTDAGKVDDVKVDGVSVVDENKVANIDLSGKQDKITSTNKLSADLLQDGITNKVVTQTEKNTWNAKTSIDDTTQSLNTTWSSNKISGELSTKLSTIDSQHKLSADLISNGTTNKVVTQAEKTSWSNKLDAITSENKLSADLIQDGNTNKTVTQVEKTTWSGKQDALPEGSNDQFLHKNEETGVIEWADAPEGGDTLTIDNGIIDVATGVIADIEPNPAQPATAYLTKLGIDLTTYALPTGEYATFSGNQIQFKDEPTEPQKTISGTFPLSWQDGIGGDLVDYSLTGNTVAVNPHREIPYNLYHEVEYIESNGTQYIETGYVPNANTLWEFKFSLNEISGRFGRRASNQRLGISFSDRSTTKVEGDIGDWYQQTDCNVVIGVKNTAVLDIPNYRCTITPIGYDHTFNPLTFNRQETLTLLARKTENTSVDEYCKAKLYSSTIYENGVDVQKLIPVLNVSTNKYGMYDIVTNTFFGNGGTGDFTGGNEVTEYIGVGDKTENLFDYSARYQGVYQKEDGTFVNNAPDAVSAFIEVEPNTTYWISETGSRRGKFFDKNKQPIQATSFDFNSTLKGTFTTGATTKYIRFGMSYIPEEQRMLIMFVKGSTEPTDYIPYGYKLPMVVTSGACINDLSQLNWISNRTTWSGAYLYYVELQQPFGGKDGYCNGWDVIPVTLDWEVLQNGQIGITSPICDYLMIATNDASTVAELKTMLSGKHFYYKQNGVDWYIQNKTIYRTTQLTANQTIRKTTDGLPNFTDLPTGYLQMGVDTEVQPSSGSVTYRIAVSLYGAITQIKLSDSAVGNINDSRLPSTLGSANQVLSMNSAGNAIEWANLPPDEIFWATKDVTTFAEILTAFNAGKLCLVDEHNLSYNIHLIYKLMAVTVSLCEFKCWSGNTEFQLIVRETGWTITNKKILYDSLVTSISSSSDDAHYPSAKATWDSINSMAVVDSDIILIGNCFRPGKEIYINRISDSFYRANRRWNLVGTFYNSAGEVTGALSDSDLDNIFDGNYETSVLWYTTDTLKIRFVFGDPGSEEAFPSYPYGYILLNFYYHDRPASISARAYCNWPAQGIGWKDLPVTNLTKDATHVMYSIRNDYYKINEFEFSITGDPTAPDGRTALTAMEMWLDRPAIDSFATVSKYGGDTIYGDLSIARNIDFANKSTSITSSGTNSQFPTTAAVYNYHDTTKLNVSDEAVTDIKINNVSILSSKTANIPVATTSDYGVIKIGERQSGVSYQTGIFTFVAETD